MGATLFYKSLKFFYFFFTLPRLVLGAEVGKSQPFCLGKSRSRSEPGENESGSESLNEGLRSVGLVILWDWFHILSRRSRDGTRAYPPPSHHPDTNLLYSPAVSDLRFFCLFLFFFKIFWITAQRTKNQPSIINRRSRNYKQDRVSSIP